VSLDSDSVALELTRVSKRFQRTPREGRPGARRGLALLFPALADEPFWAVRDVSLTVGRGECLGIVGSNGSGKSTLLKLAAGVLKPTRGQVERRGRVASLIELGAGLQPNLTGRENLKLCGVLAGLSSREVARRLDAIVAFSGLEEFLDTPVRCYSSGMSLRLAFSLAIHTDAEIVLVDDVLGIGDERFRRRSMERLHELRRGGTTLLVVGHGLAEMKRWCDRVAWLDGGVLQTVGAPQATIAAYLVASSREGVSPAAGTASAVSDGGRLLVRSARLLNGRGVELAESPLRTGAPCALELRLEYEGLVTSAVVGVGVHRDDGECVYAVNTGLDGVGLPRGPGLVKLRLEFPALELLAGRYNVNVNTADGSGLQLDFQLAAVSFEVAPETGELGLTRLAHRWTVE
jgi:ABC-type polysaccharide/polyol phosphate transport system ATPase subunit